MRAGRGVRQEIGGRRSSLGTYQPGISSQLRFVPSRGLPAAARKQQTPSRHLHRVEELTCADPELDRPMILLEDVVKVIARVDAGNSAPEDSRL